MHVSASVSLLHVAVWRNERTVTFTDRAMRHDVHDEVVPQQCTLVFQTSGVHTLTAVYAGSGAFGPSFDRRTLTVGPRVFTFADGVTGPFFDTYLLSRIQARRQNPSP